MPRIERFFANTKVSDWTSGAFGGGGGGFCAVGGNGGSVYPNPAGGIFVSHEFTASGNLYVTAGEGDVDMLIVAGGGGGGQYQVGSGGGGGAGGFRELASIPLTSTGGPGADGIYPIVVGAGGVENPGQSMYPSISDPAHLGVGNDSTGLGYTSAGGGAGGSWYATNSYPPTTPYAYIHAGIAGGSGGGGMGAVWGPPSNRPTYSVPEIDPAHVAGAGNTPPESPSQGNAGGNGAYSPPSTSYPARAVGGGGGGGAGGAGTIALIPGASYPQYAVGGNGGAGAPNSYSTGSPVLYGGGGKGAVQSGSEGTNGPGGGGGTANTGGGGISHGYWAPYYPMRAGGSGIVVIRYAVPA